jgi:hypothetical protein
MSKDQKNPAAPAADAPPADSTQPARVMAPVSSSAIVSANAQQAPDAAKVFKLTDHAEKVSFDVMALDETDAIVGWCAHTKKKPEDRRVSVTRA